MSDFRNGRIAINLDKERHLLFTLNALDEIQDKFGSFDKIGEAFEGKDGFKNLRFVLQILLNEGDLSNEILSEKQVGKLVYLGNMNYVRDCLMRAFYAGNKETAEDEEDVDIKNAETAMAN